MIVFGMASLSPVALLLLASLWGGAWPLVALLYITLFVFAMDRLLSDTLPETKQHGRGLSIVLGLAHFGLMGTGIRALAEAPYLDPGQKLALAAGLVLFFGQVSNSNAHELIHASARGPRALGRWIYISMLFGHHSSAHPKVHHVHVATPLDPNTPKPGEGFYRFLPRAWIGSFRAGWAAENALRKRRDPQPALWSHPYMAYCGGGVAMVVVAALIGGLGGVMAYMGVAFLAQSQLMMSDYVQHYGLRRAKLDNGRYEPVGPTHSWNAPHWYSSAMMLNAPRHSDHHMHPSRPYPSLRLDQDTMPQLPLPLPAMGFIALVPPLWRRMMDGPAGYWRRQSAQNP